MVIFMCCCVWVKNGSNKRWNPTYKCDELGFLLGPNNIENMPICLLHAKDYVLLKSFCQKTFFSLKGIFE